MNTWTSSDELNAGGDGTSQFRTDPERVAARYEVRRAGPGKTGRDQLQWLLERLERVCFQRDTARRSVFLQI